VTAKDLAHRREPPTKVKMLARDFIDDSLYNVSHSIIASFSRCDTVFEPDERT
jgi:hypothetical protein